jgi:hypothetical protein
MSIRGLCYGGGNFVKFSNYINSKGEHPKIMSAIGYDRLVFNKEDLNNENWLYIGNESEEAKQEVLEILKLHEGFIPIIYE